MNDFRSFNKTKRRPARPMEPVSDPAGWAPDSLRDVASWSYRLGESDIGELLSAIAAIRRDGLPVMAVHRENFPLGNFAGILADVRQELREGRGVVMLQGFPVDQLDREGQAIGYFGLGAHLGAPMSQNAQGHILGHVKDLGGDYSKREVRGYVTRAELLFHTDPCDYVGLLCLETAMRGGASRVSSSVNVYNRMLEQRPDLVKLLVEDWYFTKSGELNPGEDPWYTEPIFQFFEGYFTGMGIGSYAEKAQGQPGVPLWTDEQKEAAKLYQKIVSDCAVDLPFGKGDIQFLNNHVMLHSRRAFEDWPEAHRKRHLLRLWLYDPQSRPMVPQRREGRSGRGVELKHVALTAPLDA